MPNFTVVYEKKRMVINYEVAGLKVVWVELSYCIKVLLAIP